MSDVLQFVHQPGGTLRRYVREILWVNSEHSRVQLLLPETTLTLVFRQSGAASLHNENLPKTIVSGPAETHPHGPARAQFLAHHRSFH